MKIIEKSSNNPTIMKCCKYPFLCNGYRKNDCTIYTSLFSKNIETCNIYSHLIPCLYFLLTRRFAYSMAYGSSVIFHLFNHKEQYYHFFLLFDVLSMIIMTNVSTNYVLITGGYQIYKFIRWNKIIGCMTAIYSAHLIFKGKADKSIEHDSYMKNNWNYLFQFIHLTFWVVPLIIHRRFNLLKLGLKVYSLWIFSFLFYISYIPEKYFRKIDFSYFGNSHNLTHIGTAISGIIHNYIFGMNRGVISN